MSPLDRLTQDLAWLQLDSLDAFEAFIAQPGTHAVFLPGDVARNLESTDVAVVLPELVTAFQHRFDAAIAGPGAEAEIRSRINSFQTPNIALFRDGRLLGDVPKVRDWSDYLARISHLLARPQVAA